MSIQIEKLNQKGIEVLNAMLSSKEFTKSEKKKVSLDDITSWEAVCEIDGVDPVRCLPRQNPTNKIEYSENATSKLLRIRDCIVGEWQPDYSNINQKKWYLWLKWAAAASAFVLAYAHYDHANTHAGLGSRLCFETEAQALHFWKHFNKEINEALISK